MAAITVPVTDEGILVPSAAVQLLGGRVGDWAQIEVRLLPSVEELENKALYFIMHHLGDAVFVGPPAWVGDTWELPLRAKGLEGTFGKLVLTLEGEVLTARSTARMELREAIRAARANHPATE